MGMTKLAIFMHTQKQKRSMPCGDHRQNIRGFKMTMEEKSCCCLLPLRRRERSALAD